MTRNDFWKPIALAACLAVVPAVRAADPAPAPAETPATTNAAAADAKTVADAKAAAVAFAKAVMVDADDRVDAKMKEKEAAKLKALKDSSAGTDEQVQQAAALAAVFPAARRFREACDARFGPDNEISKGMSAVPDLLGEVERAEIRVEGDVATVVDKDRPDAKEPMKLKKVDGKWKVDLASMGSDASEHARKSPAIVRVLKESTEAVLGGRYKTALEAAEAMAPKMERATK